MAPSNSRKSNIAWCLLKRQQSRLSYEEYRTIQRYGVCQTTSQLRRAVSCKLSGTLVSTFFLAFSPDGETIASGHCDHSVRISEVKSGRCLQTLKGHPRSPWCVVFHPSNPLLASACLGGVVKLWDLTQKDSYLIRSLDCHRVPSLAFHPTDMVLLIGAGNQLRFWSCDHAEPFAVVEAESVDEQIRLVKFDPLGHHILTGVCESVNTSSVCDNTDDIDSNSGCNLDFGEYPVHSQITRTSVINVELGTVKTTEGNLGPDDVCIVRAQKRKIMKKMDSLEWRLQWWDFTHMKMCDLLNRNLNVIVPNCKLYNNSSADISPDGRLLSALVVNLMVCVFSLDKSNLGECLYSMTLVANAFSTCFSPLGTHLLVGVTDAEKVCSTVLYQDNTIAYILKLPKRDSGTENALQPLTQVASLKLQNPGEIIGFQLRANAVIWHPLIKYGLVAFGTNTGKVCFCHV